MILLFFGCGDYAGDKNTAAEGEVAVRTWTGTSDEDGVLLIPVEVGQGDVLQVVAARDRGTIATEYIYDPSGGAALDWEDWYNSAESLTEAIYVSEFATTVNWPVRAEDGPLSAGSWSVSVMTLTSDYYAQASQQVDVTVLTRAEPEPTEGALHAVIAYAGGLEGDAEVVSGTEAAVLYWQELYASYGIALTTEYTTIDVDADMPDTYEGQDEVEELVASLDRRAVLMVIGDEIGNSNWTYGEAGGIPGPYAATPAAAVEISWLAHAGSDASFSENDTLLMGETMAHEVGHYLGLFHPVEDGFEYRDALDDTDECSSYSRCESALGENLMYPYPLCAGGSNCTRQTGMTNDQVGVAQRYVGVE